jgi:hypothetical protein
VPIVWVPWTTAQEAVGHCVLDGTDCSSHCDRGLSETSLKVLMLKTSALWYGTVSYCLRLTLC